jgi:alpha-beta hydrolase superfamily lysophospholipase
MFQADSFDGLLSSQLLEEPPPWRPVQRFQRKHPIYNYAGTLPPLTAWNGIMPEESYVEMPDGMKCRSMVIRPPGKHCRTLFYIGGMGSTLEMCQPLLSSIAEEDTLVIMMEHRGQGGCGRELLNHSIAHVKNFGRYRKDIVAGMCKLLLPNQADKPVYIMAHSLGAAIVTPMLPHLPPYPCVFIAPFVETPRAPLSGTPAELIKTGLRTLVFNGLGEYRVLGGQTAEAFAKLTFEGNKYTACKEGFHRAFSLYETHPQTMIGDPSNIWLLDGYYGNARRLRGMEDAGLQAPMRIVFPIDERIVVPAAAERLFKRICAPGTLSTHSIRERHDPTLGSPDTLAELREHLNAVDCLRAETRYYGPGISTAKVPVYH